MAAINASSVKLQVDTSSTTVSGATFADLQGLQSLTLNLEADLIDVTTKDNSGRADYISGLKTSSIEFSGITDFAHTNGFESLFTAKNTRVTIAWRITDKTLDGATDNGGNRYEGTGVITTLNLEAPMEDAVTYSGTITVRGEIMKYLNNEASA